MQRLLLPTLNHAPGSLLHEFLIVLKHKQLPSHFALTHIPCKHPTNKKVKPEMTSPSLPISESAAIEFSLMISELAATQFSLMISESTGAVCADKSMRQKWK
jgi:hypothetical protein